MKGRRSPPRLPFSLNILIPRQKETPSFGSLTIGASELFTLLACFLAERVGFEPTIPCGILAFQASALGQLRYLSIWLSAVIIPFHSKFPIFFHLQFDFFDSRSIIN